jgi:Gnt-I system high-affinity gluconate transporter
MQKSPSKTQLFLILFSALIIVSFLLWRFFQIFLNKEAATDATSFLIIIDCILFLILLITLVDLNAFLAFLIISIAGGLLLGMDAIRVSQSIQKGIGDMFGGLAVVIVSGAMLGKLVAESGAAQRIASSMMKLFGDRYIQWALMVTGFIIGIPLFYNVGFVLVIPLIFTVVYRYNLPAVYIGLPMMAALSVTHGFLPPHPAPTALVSQFPGASMSTTLQYGLILAVPTVIIAGIFFSKALKNIKAPMLKTFQAAQLPEENLPGLANSIFSSLFPVVLLGVTALLLAFIKEDGILKTIITFVSDPAILMLVSLGVATYMLGLRMRMTMKRVMDVYGEAVKDIGMLLLIMSGAGALKQILIESGVSNTIALYMEGWDVHPLILAWLITCIIRVCVGSATVAGLTAAGIMVPLVVSSGVDPNLMVLAVGAGSLMFSHVNDAGFWLFKEYFNLSIKDTIKSWSMMETIVAVCGIIGVMTINFLIS